MESSSSKKNPANNYRRNDRIKENNHSTSPSVIVGSAKDYQWRLNYWVTYLGVIENSQDLQVSPQRLLTNYKAANVAFQWRDPAVSTSGDQTEEPPRGTIGQEGPPDEIHQKATISPVQVSHIHTK